MLNITANSNAIDGAPLVLVLDANGAPALLPWAPVQVPGSEWRHARPLPPRAREAR